MKLITFQSLDAFKELKEKGILKIPPQVDNLINLKKYGVPYDFMVNQMKQKIPNKNGATYPLWAWEQCGSFIAPRKRKNLLNKEQQPKVKITFLKPDNQVLVSDYMAYSFILSGHIVPKTQKEYLQFLKKTEEAEISLEELKGFVRNEKTRLKVKQLFSEIQKTWPRIFNPKSNVHQACLWNIKWEEVEKIEQCCDSHFLYNSMNPVRADGTRPDWKKEYLKFIC